MNEGQLYFWNVDGSNSPGRGWIFVSSVRKQGKTKWVQITGLAGEPCVVKIPGWTQIKVINSLSAVSRYLGQNEFQLNLKKGDSVLLEEKIDTDNPVMEPVITQKRGQNAYGIKKTSADQRLTVIG